MACTTANRADVLATFVRGAIATLDSQAERDLHVLHYFDADESLARRAAFAHLVSVTEELEAVARTAAPDPDELEGDVPIKRCPCCEKRAAYIASHQPKRVCALCAGEFMAPRSNAKYCDACKPVVKRIQAKLSSSHAKSKAAR